MSQSICRLNVNGDNYELLIDPFETLSHVLRERLDLTGTKEGCSMGECGACTVQIAGVPVMSCLTLALDVGDKPVRTIEGLASPDGLDVLQEKFLETGAVQCGFCTPGMILSARSLLDSGVVIDKNSVKQALAGNHCRCTGYTKIIEAVLAAATAEQQP